MLPWISSGVSEKPEERKHSDFPTFNLPRNQEDAAAPLVTQSVRNKKREVAAAFLELHLHPLVAVLGLSSSRWSP